jgi:diaminopimelate epimerase
MAAMTLAFHKMHGLGNDFIVIDGREHAVALDTARVRNLADRKTGIGCDQLILIGTAADADVSMRIWNADGSEVDACGNATRCVALLLGEDCTIETKAGLLVASVNDETATVDMGKPIFDWDRIPLAYAMDTRALPVGWGELERPAAISVGNPHLAFLVEDIDAVPLDVLGPEIENDPLFPERINVNIYSILSRGHVRMRTWERGAGLTLACGTGACATFAAGRRLGLLDEKVRMDLPGGTLYLSERQGHLMMSGPGVLVFSGETHL